MTILNRDKDRLQKEKYMEMVRQIIMNNNNLHKLLHNLKKMVFPILCNKINNFKNKSLDN